MTRDKESYVSPDLKLCECGHCDKMIYASDCNGYPQRFYFGHHMRKKDRDYSDEGVTYNRGYRFLRIPGHHLADKRGRVPEHRKVWEDENNACLLWWADVDHKDNNKLNNHPSNLQAMMKGHHTIRHRKGVPRTEETKLKLRLHHNPKSNLNLGRWKKRSCGL